MSWNGSGSRYSKTAVKTQYVKRGFSGKAKGLAVGLVVALAGAALFLLMDGEPNPVGEIEHVEKPKSIEIVKPEAVADPVAAESHDEAPKDPANTYRDERGILRYQGGQRAYDPSRPKTVVKMNEDSEGNKLYKTSVFTSNRAEHEIERLMKARPGEAMIGMRRYDERFEADYRKSCEIPIIIDKDDSPEVVEMKTAMIEVKKEINDRLRAGEKLSDILDETRKELQKLAQYKHDIKDMILKETSNPDMSQDEVQAYIDAANKMLEEKGISGLRGTAILRRNLSIKAKGNN